MFCKHEGGSAVMKMRNIYLKIEFHRRATVPFYREALVSKVVIVVKKILDSEENFVLLHRVD